jgi:hypothetical protein
MKDPTMRKRRPVASFRLVHSRSMHSRFMISRFTTMLPMADATPTTNRFTRAALAAAASAMLVGCGGKALAPNASDALRAELAVRTKERDEAVARAAELDAKLFALTAERNARVDPEVAEAMPALAAVGLSSLSAARLNAPTKADLAIVLAPTDGLGRFIQLTGTVRASVAALIPGRDPVPAGSVTLAPKALRDSYRSGFMGTHYTIELPIEWDGSETARGLSVAGEFVDGTTGKRYPFLGTVPVVPAKPGTTVSPSAAGASR